MSCSMSETIGAYKALHSWRLKDATSFENFAQVFQRRFNAFNQLGGLHLDENYKVFIFTFALSEDEDWSERDELQSCLINIAGLGYDREVKPVTFEKFLMLARSHEAALRYRRGSSVASVASSGAQKRSLKFVADREISILGSPEQIEARCFVQDSFGTGEVDRVGKWNGRRGERCVRFEASKRAD
jgi:hypothetical protein